MFDYIKKRAEKNGFDVLLILDSDATPENYIKVLNDKKLRLFHNTSHGNQARITLWRKQYLNSDAVMSSVEMNGRAFVFNQACFGFICELRDAFTSTKVNAARYIGADTSFALTNHNEGVKTFYTYFLKGRDIEFAVRESNSLTTGTEIKQAGNGIGRLYTPVDRQAVKRTVSLCNPKVCHDEL